VGNCESHCRSKGEQTLWAVKQARNGGMLVKRPHVGCTRHQLVSIYIDSTRQATFSSFSSDNCSLRNMSLVRRHWTRLHSTLRQWQTDTPHREFFLYFLLREMLFLLQRFRYNRKCSRSAGRQGSVVCKQDTNAALTLRTYVPVRRRTTLRLSAVVGSILKHSTKLLWIRA